MRSVRGIALYLVLVVTAIVVCMMGFFVAVNEQSVQTYKVQMMQTQALQAARGGLDYLRYALEYDRRWGHGGFGMSTPAIPGVRGLSITVRDGTRIVEGVLLDAQDNPTGDSFTALVLNNIDQAAPGNPTSYNESFQGRSVSISLPSNTALLRVEGRSGSFQKTIEANLIGGPLYDSAATSLKQIDLSTNLNVTVASKDPMRNWLRSNTDILLPDFVHDSTRNVNFSYIGNSSAGNTTGNETAPARSLIWAKGDVDLRTATGNIALGQNPTDANGSIMATAMDKSNANIQPRSALNRQLYDMKMEDLKTNANATVYPLRGGSFDFAVRTFVATFTHKEEKTDEFGIVKEKTVTDTYSQAVPFLVWSDSAGNPLNEWYNADIAAQLYAHEGELQSVAITTSLGDVNLGGGIPGQGISGNASVPVPAPGSPLSFSFDGNSFELAANSAINVSGDFHIGAPDYGSNATAGDMNQRPTIKLAGDPNNPGQPSAYLISPGGSIDIQGRVTGVGGVAAGKNLTLSAGTNAQGTTNVTAGAKDALVLYGKNVNVQGDSGQDLAFRGLIYADQNLQFTSFNPGSRTTGGRLRKLTLEGAIVARDGNLDCTLADTLELIYNPAYLTEFTKGMRDNRSSLQMTNWRIL